MPVSTANNRTPKVIQMKVGERRKIMSKTLLTAISPGMMMGPAYQLRSSNTHVLIIDSNDLEPVAWAKALAPGRADIQHTHDEGQFTRVIVNRQGEQAVGSNLP